MKQIIYSYIFVLMALSVDAQNPAKGFELFNQKKTTDAQRIFLKALSKEKYQIPALYGLSLIFACDNPNFRNPDSAYAYASQAEAMINACDKKQREWLVDNFQLTVSKILALKYTIAADAFKYINQNDVEQLRKYAAKYKFEKTAQRARDMITEYETFQNYSDSQPIEYYEKLIDKYPENPNIGKPWMKIYDYYTADGEFLTLEQFEMSFLKFPFDSLIVREKDNYLFAKTYHCFDFVVDANRPKCREYIQKTAPKHTAYHVFQNLLKPYIDARKWDRVANEIKTYAGVFGSDPDFLALAATINRNDSVVEKKSVGNAINTPKGHEYSPVISANGKHLYFCGMNRHDNLGGEDIFVSEKTTNGWGEPQLLKEISTRAGNEAPEALSADETKMVLYYNGNIFCTQKTYAGWNQSKPMPDVNTSGWDGDAVYTADGKAVIFASEGWGKVGRQYPAKNRKDGFDIYIAFRTPFGWTKPMNLGPTINTPWCDRYPFLHPDGKTLYFCSEGHGSLGGSDVYRSVRLNDSSWTEWSEPENLGKYINTTGDDNGYKISTDGTKAYFSVNKANNIDIYELDLPRKMQPDKVTVISGVIRDENNLPITADITVENLETGEEVASFASDPITGEYVIVLPLGKNYGFYVSRSQYYPTSENIDLQGNSQELNIDKQIRLVSLKSMIEKGIPITINNVFFDTDKFDLRPESFLELKRLLAIVNDNPSVTVKIEGHTDNDGTDEHNNSLSLNRAGAVKQYLVHNGIADSRIEVYGYGSSKPLNQNESAAEKQKNRRVEVRFVKTK